MGADPDRPDVFLQIDWMADAKHDQHPDPAAIALVVDAFRRAPVRSPTGSTGIALHVDAGPESQARGWARALVRQCSAVLDELTFLAPWISPPIFGGLTALDEIPTLRELAGLEIEIPAELESRSEALRGESPRR